MGMYHYAYSRKYKFKVYVAKSTPIHFKEIGVRLNSYYSRWGNINGEHCVRSGLILQSMLRQHGKVEGVKPILRKKPYRKKDNQMEMFFGHTYLDKTCIGVLEKFKRIDEHLACMLINMLSKYPGRWLFYGDDMSEPLRKVRGTRSANLDHDGTITVDLGWRATTPSSSVLACEVWVFQ